MSFEEVATINKGVVIRQSSIHGAGNGLFTGRPFFKNDLITEYCGPIIDHQKALKLRKRGRATHVRVLNSQWLYIDGLKQPVQGQGGASFANDARQLSAYNAVFVQRFDRRLGRDRVFLKATRYIDANEEVFVSYGNTYWATSKLQPQPAAKQQQPVGDGQDLLGQEQQLGQQLQRSSRQQRRWQLSQQQELQGINSDAQHSEPEQSKQQQQDEVVKEQRSAGSTSSVQQQLGSARVGRQQRVHLPSKRVVLQEMQQAETELQRASTKRRVVVQQQPEQQPQVHDSSQAGSQESSNTQVGWRRSARVRCQQEKQQQKQQQPEQQQQHQQQQESFIPAGISSSSAAAALGAAAEAGTRLHWGKQKKQPSCAKIVPGSQKGKRCKPSSRSPELVARQAAAAAAVAVPGSAGLGTAAVAGFTVKVMAPAQPNLRH